MTETNGTSLIVSIARSIFTIAFLSLAACSVFAQSSDQAFPTAITENQLSGQIKARDIGDARLTTYYFTFNGTQGDLFINLVTKNLSGSIDVFTADGMRPLTKILVYADLSASETGRVIYLRKPEKLILRVEGRTPNDDPAEFQIKFAGGFEAAVPRTDEPPVPKVGELPANDSGVRVNSVGTIIAVVPKPTPSPRAERPDAEKAESTSEKVESSEEKVAERIPKPEENKTEEKSDEEMPVAKKTPPANKTARNRRSAESTSTRPPRNSQEQSKDDTRSDQSKARETETAVKEKPTKSRPKAEENIETPASPPPNPLANVNLVIMFKDGTKVQRPMTEVLRFTADQTTLTIINKNGRIAKFSILEVASVTIQ